MRPCSPPTSPGSQPTKRTRSNRAPIAFAARKDRDWIHAMSVQRVRAIFYIF